MPGQIERIAELTVKYVRGSITLEEMLELEAWNNQSAENRERFEQRTREIYILNNLALYEEAENDKVEIKARMDFVGTGSQPKIAMISSKWWKISAAAVFISAISIISVLVLNNQKEYSKNTASAKPVQLNDLLPGTDRATLTLASGQVIVLDSSANKHLAMQGSVRVVKNAGGLLAYKITNETQAQISYNTLTTPKAGQFQVDLPDGTHVWLNNASSLRYPTVFAGAGREVELLQGEAFFQVAHDSHKPFRVKVVGDIQVQDLGTGFNIMAYADEQSIQTTLVEGSAKVISKESAITLSPGQQVQAKDNTLLLNKHANIEQAIAWKNGNFQFENADIETVLRQLSRWYDVDKVVYEGKQTEHSFSGIIPRDYTANDVLRILELSGVHFKIQDKTIIVSE